MAGVTMKPLVAVVAVKRVVVTATAVLVDVGLAVPGVPERLCVDGVVAVERDTDVSSRMANEQPARGRGLDCASSPRLLTREVVTASPPWSRFNFCSTMPSRLLSGCCSEPPTDSTTPIVTVTRPSG